MSLENSASSRVPHPLPSQRSGEIAQQVTGVSYHVGSLPILTDVTLGVRYGEVLALVGPNGAGKSTLLSVLSGDIAPSSGSVSFEGRELAQWPARELARARAVLLQANQVAFSFTAQQVIDMGRAPWIGTPQSDDDERAIRDATSAADVGHLTQRGFPHLSGGEKARVSLARVLAQETKVVLLDEPTAALDLKHQESVLQIARELAQRGRAVIVVLHDLSLAGAYADEVAILANGALVARGVPGDVLTEERISEVYGAPVRVLSDPDTGRPVVIPRRAL
ncbi:heme ABC transporter ATP-binding protein [Leucobacter sp. NPDC077196]|uniref:heme ABC transporter ATP-binding protein n=1 Tax=Leucobacter sp. NPDC077196 TaxID=3154959 RepID=UPI003419FA1A